MASPGQALKALYTCCVIDSTMLLLYSHFTEEEIKAQRSLSNLHEMKHPIGGSGEGVSRSKSKIKKRRTAWIRHRHGKEHSVRRERRRVRVCWNDVLWGSWRGRQRADPLTGASQV